MEPITVNYKVLDARAKVPAYATPGSAAADLCAVLGEPLTVQPIKVLAEGIESREEYEFLRDNGIDLVQGFYLGRPE